MIGARKMTSKRIDTCNGIKACGHRFLVLPDKLKEEDTLDEDAGLKKTKSGIYVPDDSEIVKEEKQKQKAIHRGVLVAVGKTAWQAFDDGEPWAEVGDRVGYSQYAGKEIEGKDGTKYIMLVDEDLISVFYF